MLARRLRMQRRPHSSDRIAPVRSTTHCTKSDDIIVITLAAPYASADIPSTASTAQEEVGGMLREDKVLPEPSGSLEVDKKKHHAQTRGLHEEGGMVLGAAGGVVTRCTMRL